MQPWPDVSRRLTAVVAVFALYVLATSAGLAQQAPNPAAAANNAFALDLYRQLADDGRNDGKNLWFSPYSITSALAMTAEGARGDTRAQMARTLRFSDAQAPQLQPIHEGMAALRQQLESRSPTAGSETTPTGAASPNAGYELLVANALWGDQRYPFHEDYVAATQRYYGTSGIFPVDFLRNAESARVRINGWVAEQTREKIIDPLPPGGVKQDTRLVLANAVYFKGSWVFPFNTGGDRGGGSRGGVGRGGSGGTTPQPFYLDSTRTVTAPLMQMQARIQHVESDELQAIWLPFGAQRGVATQDMAMIVILPRAVDGLGEVETALVEGSLDTLTNARSMRLVRVFLPKFKMTTGFELRTLLSSMGMPDAFSLRADFSGISPVADVDRLHIDQVYHKAFLDVDETGAEAAAATVVAMMGGGAAPRPEEPVVFRADHPFLVLLRHNPSGTVLFLGRVMDPTR